MSYATASRAAYSFPAKIGYFVAAWAWLCSRENAPQAGMREISMEEWNATPTQYLLHPDHHPKIWGRCPGESGVEDSRAELFARAGKPDFNPSSPAGGGHGHGH